MSKRIGFKKGKSKPVYPTKIDVRRVRPVSSTRCYGCDTVMQEGYSVDSLLGYLTLCGKCFDTLLIRGHNALDRDSHNHGVDSYPTEQPGVTPPQKGLKTRG